MSVVQDAWRRTFLEEMNGILLDEKRQTPHQQRFSRYQTDLVGYAKNVLNVQPWRGENGNKGQYELFLDIQDSCAKQLAGGKNVPNIFRVEAGHGVGKTFGAAVVVNWFFDSFAPSVTTTTAPTGDQVEKLLWKDIKRLRPATSPGEQLATMLRAAPDHFAYGRTTSDKGGTGTERFQGQHNDFALFVLDEAEGIPDYVYTAVEAQMTGGTVVIVLMLANPRTRTSMFHKYRKNPGVLNYRLSVLDHPNVVNDDNIVPGASTRQWVDRKIDKLCKVVYKHNEDNHTFEVAWRPGKIYEPNPEFCYQVLGLPPKNMTTVTTISAGVYEAAVKREIGFTNDIERATIGIDAARFGADYGTVYCCWNGEVWRASQIAKGRTNVYVAAVVELIDYLRSEGVTKIHVRVDGSGGFGNGIIDELLELGEELDGLEEWHIVEVLFGSSANNSKAYYDLVTEMYFEANQSLQSLRIVDPTPELEIDLTERQWVPKNKGGATLKKLEDKETFRAKTRSSSNPAGRSPDDGDGLVLCVAPDHIFGGSGSIEDID